MSDWCGSSPWVGQQQLGHTCKQQKLHFRLTASNGYVGQGFSSGLQKCLKLAGFRGFRHTYVQQGSIMHALLTAEQGGRTEVDRSVSACT